MMMKFKNIIILIPAYMPSRELVGLVETLLEGGFSRVIVVDDGSGREYSEVFEALPSEIRILRHDLNKGKGRALKTGLAYIHVNYPDYIGVITCDADGQHRPDDICKVAAALLEQKETPGLILGSRTFKGNVPPRSAFGNTVTRGVYFLASGVRLRDTQTGLRAIPRGMIPFMLKIPGERYEYEFNMLLEAAKRKIKIMEVEIETVYFDGNKSSHFHTIRDSAIIYGNIARFSLSSLICFGIDFLALMLFKLLSAGLDAGSSLLVSVIAARVVSSLVNFLLNRHVVFKKNGSRSLIKYYALVLCILGMNYGLLYGLNITLGVPLFWAKLITELALFFVSYTVQKKLIFNGIGSAAVKERV